MNTTILLVDDEVPFVDAMTRRLERRGLNILAAHSGRKALDIIDTDRTIDVVVLDVKMPGMDGIETLREIKRKSPLIEVIMLTGHGTIQSGVEGMKLGAFDYLTKPCDIEQLLAKVREAKNRKRGHEEKITQARIQEIALRRGD